MRFWRPIGRALSRALAVTCFLVGALFVCLGVLWMLAAVSLWPGEAPIKVKSDDGEKTRADLVLASNAAVGDHAKSLRAWLN